MFAILETGGKQYKVEEGDVLDVELLTNEDKEDFIFETVLLIKDKETLVGAPYVKNAKIKAKILEKVKASKIIVFKKKSKKQYKKTQGHRQKLHRIKIEKIEVKAPAKPKAPTKAKTAAKTGVKKVEKKEK